MGREYFGGKKGYPVGRLFLAGGGYSVGVPSPEVTRSSSLHNGQGKRPGSFFRRGKRWHARGGWAGGNGCGRGPLGGRAGQLAPGCAWSASKIGSCRPGGQTSARTSTRTTRPGDRTLRPWFTSTWA